VSSGPIRLHFAFCAVGSQIHFAAATRTVAEAFQLRDVDQMKVTKLKRRSAAKKMSEVRVRGKRLPNFGDELVVVRTRRFPSLPRVISSREEAGALLKKVGHALNRPGIRKKAIFKNGNPQVFAYSADPDKIVRRSIDGKRSIGRLRGNRFQAS
jgi:hypothetical protein